MYYTRSRLDNAEGQCTMNIIIACSTNEITYATHYKKANLHFQASSDISVRSRMNPLTINSTSPDL